MVLALDGFVVSAGSKGINYPVKKYREVDDPLRKKFSPKEGERCIIDLETNAPYKTKHTCYQLLDGLIFFVFFAVGSFNKM